MRLRVPPLRERLEEVPRLVEHFLGRKHPLGRTRRLAPGVLEALQAYPWPGNVRELENCLERAIVLSPGEEIRLEDLSPRLRGPDARPPGGGGAAVAGAGA
ncbi:MAG: hypothetical protein HY722_16125, partial [Planctomycetes bacterium]|nr:hypothetical protein [Planctomycetota bacterium]